MNCKELLDCAVAAATAAGTHAKNNRSRSNQIEKSFSHDVKLKLDRESQEQAESVIRGVYPDHGLLGEETPSADVSGETVWIIDPIDGTVNFFHGLPLWCSSVAVRHEGRVLAGAVYAPDLGLCYTASLDQESRCNGEPIQASGVECLSEAMIATGVDRESEGSVKSFELLGSFSRNTQKIRIMGSAALDVCNVAHGRTEGYYEGCIFIWDIAAAGLIVEQAGGRTEILDTAPGHRVKFMASNKHVFDEFRRIIVKYSEPL